METVTLTIQVPKNIGVLLEEKARGDGKNVSQYVEGLIERDMDTRKLIDEILLPVRQKFAGDGLTEEELDVLVENERQSIWEEKNGKA